MPSTVFHVTGARPNFPKAAPVLAALAENSAIRQVLIHTGQHYDDQMSAVFFRQLGLPHPDVNLGVGPGSHASQTGAIMMRFEELLAAGHPDMVVVYGDVNSTLAVTLVAAKSGVVGVATTSVGSDAVLLPAFGSEVIDEMLTWLNRS